MFKWFASALLLTLVANQVFAATAKVYVWRDKNGQLVYSDTPKPGATETDQKEIRDPNISESIDTTILDPTPEVKETQYSISIINPEPATTIRDNTGTLTVTARVKPVFKIQSHRIQLYLDGKKYGRAKSSARFILHNIDRGEHSVSLKILDNKGKVIASSEPVTFYLYRNSVIKHK